MIWLETQRLRLRDWRPEDVDLYVRMNGDPQVRAYYPGLLSPQQSQQEIDRIKGDLDERGYGLFAVELKAKEQFIGYTGFSHPRFEAYFTPCVEIGWRLDPTFWHQGFATEAAAACVRAGFDKWRFQDIYAFTSRHNYPSEQVMIRIGMKKCGYFQHPALPADHWLSEHVLYQLQG